MKNTVIIFCLICIFSAKVFGQTDPVAIAAPQITQVNFFEGTWEELLEYSKKENRPFFVDIYTEWCGPCKLMSKFTFTDTQVTDLVNSNFIAYQIDAEKGQGVDIADTYKVKAYPTVLFFNAEGKSLGKVVGYYDAERFLGALDKYLKKAQK